MEGIMPGWMMMVAQSFFAVMAVCTLFEWRQIGQRDGLVRSFEYAAAAVLSMLLGSWWPLAIGFLLIALGQRTGFNRV